MSEEFLPQFIRLIAALVFVIALMGGLALILRKLGISGKEAENKTAKRLKLIESLPLDPRRRLVLIQRDETQHLVILSANGETVIETNIEPVQEKDES